MSLLGAFQQKLAAAREEQLVAAGIPVVNESGSPEGGSMASADTIQTMRASGGFTIPESLKGMLPVLLIFVLVVLIIFKK